MGAGGVSCAKAGAASAPDGPPLAMPAPPDRVLTPVEPPLASAPPPESETPPTPTAATPRTPPRPPDPKPQPPAVAAQAPPPVAIEPRQVLTSPAANSASERSVRDVLTRASRNLARVNYGRLSADGRAQYEQSKRFSEQAEEALKEQNLIFAATLADKAATLAAELLNQ